VSQAVEWEVQEIRRNMDFANMGAENKEVDHNQRNVDKQD
jgi:hypothetical protein